MKLIIRYIKRHLAMFLISIFFLSIETSVELLMPSFMARIVDIGVAEKSVSQILHYGVIMLSLASVGLVGAIVRNNLASRTSELVGAELRSDLYEKVQSLSLENIDNLKPASIITRITNDVTQIVNFVQGIMRIMMKTPILCIGTIILIVIQTPRQLPVIAAVIAVSAAFIAANMKLGYPQYRELQVRLDKLNNISREFLMSIRVIKAFNAEEVESGKFYNVSSDVAETGTNAARVLAIFGPLINLTVNFGIIILLWLSKAQNAGEIGRLMASVNYMTQLLFALGNVSNILNNAVRATASSNRIQEILEMKPAQKPGAIGISDTHAGVEFDNVSFTYAGAARPAINNLSFTAMPGETIGIIGSTGSGKSTLISLVPRFYDVASGKVLVGGTDVNDLDMNVLRGIVSVVPQKALLFSGSIAENLRFGRPDAPEEDILSASEIACAHDFVSTFADGYDTELGQGGVNLSGGQKQRLCIARALITNPNILILDDCTSALDSTTEAKLLGSLSERTRDITVLLISQRISTVMRCDRILCMEDGRAQGFGTHRELMSSCGQYRAIYESQIGCDKNA